MPTANIDPRTESVASLGGHDAELSEKTLRKFTPKATRNLIEHAVVLPFQQNQAARDAHWERFETLKEKKDDAVRALAMFNREEELNGTKRDDVRAELESDLAAASESIKTHQARFPRIYPDMRPEDVQRFTPSLRRPMLVRTDIALGGEPTLEKLAQTRAEIVETRDEIKALEKARLPPDEAFAAFEKQVKRLVRSAENHIGFGGVTRLQDTGSGRLREMPLNLPMLNLGDREVVDFGALALVACEAHVLALGEKKLRQIYSRAKDNFEDTPISKADRLAKIAKLKQRICDLEDREGAILRALAAQGVPVTIRKDANLGRMLGLIPAPLTAEAAA